MFFIFDFKLLNLSDTSSFTYPKLEIKIYVNNHYLCQINDVIFSQF